MQHHTEEYSSTGTNPSGPNESPRTPGEIPETKRPKMEDPYAHLEEDTLFAEERMEIFRGRRRHGMYISTKLLADNIKRDHYHRAYCAELETKCKDAMRRVHDAEMQLLQLDIAREKEATECKTRQKKDAAAIKKLEETVKSQMDTLSYLEYMCSQYKLWMSEQTDDIHAFITATRKLQDQLAMANATIQSQESTIDELEMKLAEHKDRTG